LGACLEHCHTRLVSMACWDTIFLLTNPHNIGIESFLLLRGSWKRPERHFVMNRTSVWSLINCATWRPGLHLGLMALFRAGGVKTQGCRRQSQKPQGTAFPEHFLLCGHTGRVGTVSPSLLGEMCAPYLKLREKGFCETTWEAQSMSFAAPRM
jgi:hypothetical protein